jgi:CRP-like cAMP-binding protein
VLFQLIMDRDCVQLRQFYEIVIKAYQRGMLHVEGAEAPAPVKPERWPHELPGTWARFAAIAGVVLAVAAVLARPTVLPASIWEIALGWLLACGGVAAGNWLAAAVVRRAGAEIYASRFIWRSPLPRFQADLDDAVMGGTAAVADAALAQLAVMLAAFAAATVASPGTAAFLAGTLAIMTAPFWWSPGLRLMHAVAARRRADDKRDFQFEPNRATWYAFTTQLGNVDLRFVGLHLFYSLGWVTTVLAATGILIHGNGSELWRAFNASGGPRLTAFIVIALLTFILAAALSGLGAVAYLAWREWLARRPRRAAQPRSAEATPEGVLRCVTASQLFQLLPAPDRAALAGCFRPERFAAGALIIRQGEAGDKLYLLYGGRVEVTRSLPNGREDHVAELVPGDVFGEIALLNRSPRTRSIRCLEPATVLSLTREAFEGMVLSRLSRTQIEDAVQKIAFLQRTPLAAGWSPHALAAFARRAAFQDYPADAYVLHEGEDNHFFYLVHEGRLAVQRGSEEIAQLGIGDFFGEISLLQNSITKATIVTRTPARFLVMHKRDFMQFFAKDSAIGLQFEAISSRRLGEPIFPLQGKSLDLLRA